MLIGLAALTSSTFLAFGKRDILDRSKKNKLTRFHVVMRSMLKRMNKKLDEDELGAMKGANWKRIEDAARLEGITLEEAIERKKGFRYLY